jgi:hypothetical protein
MPRYCAFKRIAAICFAGLAWLTAIVSYQHAHRLKPAPIEIQESGRVIIEQGLATLDTSPFAHTKRGMLIATEIQRLLEGDHIVFASMQATRGLTWDPLLGRQTIYIKVIPLANGNFLHQRPEDLMEALAHEAAHCIKQTLGRISLEEECDCFAAGVEVAHIIAGERPPELLRVDGHPIATFVLNSYPKAKRSPRYRPVGQSRSWLSSRTGPLVSNRANEH